MSPEPKTETPHHCAPQDIAALIERLEALADPEQEAMPSFADTDWRTLSSVCHRVISHLVDLAATPTFCDVCGGPAKLDDIEQYRLQMAGISTAALGYWKESDGILPDYDTLALRDVAKLYAKYDALYKARTEWVEVTERLPEDRSEVLFFSGDLRNPASMLLGMYIDGEFCCAGYTMANVTHWAKRPAQPDIEPPQVV